MSHVAYEWVMSHTHIPHPCHTHDWVTSHVQCGISHIWMRFLHECVTTHVWIHLSPSKMVRQKCFVPLRYQLPKGTLAGRPLNTFTWFTGSGGHTIESCHTYGWVMSHIWMGHVAAQVMESCRAYDCVMSHLWTSHVARMYDRVISHVHMSPVAHMMQSCHT